MKKTINISIGLALTIPVFFTGLLTANAQKQPQIQEASVRAPDNVKIDGKIYEWPNPFANPKQYSGFLSAFNSASRIYYTVANDDDNLYLVVRGLGNAVARKVLLGGVTFTISHAVDRKREKAADNVTVIFPVPLDIKATSNVMATLNQLVDYVGDSVANRKPIDSIVAIADNRLAMVVKEIRVVGVREVPDPVVSVYNTQGFKAAARFIKLQPVIELAIPLKYLGLSIDHPAQFSYHIKLSAPPGLGMNDDDNSQKTPVELYMDSTTDFWGTYTLVKK